MSTEKKNMSIRLPESVRQWIGEQADLNGRSISGEIAYRMKKMMELEGGVKKSHA